MLFMNSYEIELAVARHKDHPVLGKAVWALFHLMDTVDANSDGWAYWAAPVKAARQLMVLIQSNHSNPDSATEADVKKALIPIKAFYTRHKDKLIH